MFSFQNMSSSLAVWRRWSWWNHQSLCQVHRDFHKYTIPETIMTLVSFFFFSSVSWLTLIGLNARALLESPRRPLFCRFPCSMDSFRLHRGPRWDAGGRSIPQMLSSLVDAEFCDPICISYPSTKLPTEWNVSSRESVAWTNMHMSISPLWHSFLSWTIAPSGQK